MSTEPPAAGERSPPPAARRRDWEMLLICAAVLAAAPLLEVRPAGRVGPRGLPRLVLPQTCMAREWFGVDCPGCGLTRSYIHLARGDWASSVRCHRVGWVLLAATIAQIPYRVYTLSRPGRRLPAAVANAFGTSLIALLIGNWLVGFLW